MTIENPKQNSGFNLHSIVDRLDSLAMFTIAFMLAIISAIFVYKIELPENKFLTLTSFTTIIGVVIFCYKWVQKQVLTRANEKFNGTNS